MLALERGIKHPWRYIGAKAYSTTLYEDEKFSSMLQPQKSARLSRNGSACSCSFDPV